jgi:hypothetical protein
MHRLSSLLPPNKPLAYSIFARPHGIYLRQSLELSACGDYPKGILWVGWTNVIVYCFEEQLANRV